MLTAALALASCPPGNLTPIQVREDLELAISAAEAAMPDIFWRQTWDAWERRKSQARRQAEKAHNEEDLFRALNPLMRGIGEGHLALTRSEGMTCRYRATARLFPLDLLWRDDGAFVMAAHGEARDVPPGSELLSINGTDHLGMVEEMMQVTGHDGEIRTGVMRDRSGRGYAVARWIMRGNEKDYRVRLRTPDGRVLERSLQPVTVSDRPIPADDPPPVASLRWVDADTAYLYVPTFSNRRYRDVGADFQSTMQRIFDELASRGAKNLILDLRDNGGGSEPNESILFSFLVEAPIRKYASVRSRANRISVRSLSGKLFTHDIYDDEELATVEPAPNGDLLRKNVPPEGLMTRWRHSKPVFTGRLVVLAGGYTFSGGAELASMLRAKNRGVFVGEEVGGTHGGNTSGYRWDLTLPNSGVELGIPLLAFRFVWPEVPEHRGALPHCKVQPSVGEERIVRDAAYDVAVHSLQKSWTEPSASSC